MEFDLDLVFKILRTIIIVLVLYFFLNWLLRLTERRLLKDAKTKTEKSNIKIFFQVSRYVLILLIVIFAILSYTGSLAGIGVTAGLLSAALGWALQRPITGMAAWLMVVIKRPFEIGDRVIIGQVKGDVVDITLTHIHIGEIGGTIASEETSGRVILIPNAKLFEQDIVNYTKEDELILDQVKFTITFESDINKAQKIAKEAAEEVIKNYLEKTKEPYTRTQFQASGIDVVIRYFIPAPKREEASSIITQKIFLKINEAEDVEFAYPHTEVLLRKK
jgi:small-conductance mechanosensitive channel